MRGLAVVIVLRFVSGASNIAAHQGSPAAGQRQTAGARLPDVRRVRTRGKPGCSASPAGVGGRPPRGRPHRRQSIEMKNPLLTAVLFTVAVSTTVICVPFGQAPNAPIDALAAIGPKKPVCGVTCT